MARPIRQMLFGLRVSAGRAGVEAVVVLALFMFAPLILLVPRFESFMDRSGVWGIALFNASVVGLLLGAINIAHSDSWGHIGFSRPRRFGQEVLVGSALVVPCYLLSVVVAGAMVGVSVLFDGTSIDEIAASRKPMIDLAAGLSTWSILPAALIIGFTEEVLFRGFLLSRLVVICRVNGVAVIICALLFGALHFPTQGWLGFAQTTLAGTVLGILTIRRNSVWAASICHAGVDVIGLGIASAVAPYFQEIAP